MLRDNLNTCLYYSADRVGKDLEVILIDFGMILDSSLNDLGGHVGVILLLLVI